MDITALAGMVFVLIILGMVGGFVLLFPVTRRLGAILERRLQAGNADESSRTDLRRLEATVRDLQDQVEQIAERQTFTDSLLSQRERIRLPGEPETRQIGPRA